MPISRTVVALLALVGVVLLAGCFVPNDSPILGAPVYPPLSGRMISNASYNLTPVAGALVYERNLTWPSNFGPPVGLVQIVISVTNATNGMGITGKLSLSRNMSTCASPGVAIPDEVLNSGANLTSNTSYTFVTPMLGCEALNFKYSGGGAAAKIQKLVVQDLYDGGYAAYKT